MYELHSISVAIALEKIVKECLDVLKSDSRENKYFKSVCCNLRARNQLNQLKRKKETDSITGRG